MGLVGMSLAGTLGITYSVVDQQVKTTTKNSMLEVKGTDDIVQVATAKQSATAVGTDGLRAAHTRPSLEALTLAGRDVLGTRHNRGGRIRRHRGSRRHRSWLCR